MPDGVACGRSPALAVACRRCVRRLWGRSFSPWPSSLCRPMCFAGGPIPPRTAMGAMGQLSWMRQSARQP
eukprot:7592137-Pyramimonas_sp.AAC.1